MEPLSEEQMAQCSSGPTPLMPPSPPLVRIWGLGPFRLERRQADGSWTVLPPASWHRYPQGRRLLQRLLCSRERRLSVARVQEDLWPQSEADLAHRYLQEAARQARRLLGQQPEGPRLLWWEAGCYWLAGQGLVWVDAEAARELLKEVEHRGPEQPEVLPLVEQAVALLRRGSWLSDQRAAWAWPEREALGRLARQALRWLGQQREQQGRLEEAEACYRACYEEEPLEEEGLSELVHFYCRQGQMQRAQRVWEAGLQRFQQAGIPLREEAFPVQQGAGVPREPAPLIARQPDRSVLPDMIQSFPEAGEHASWLMPASGMQRGRHPAEAPESGWLPPPHLLLSGSVQMVRLIAFILRGTSLPLGTLKAILNQEVTMLDSQPVSPSSSGLSRRQTLLALASLPLGLLGLTQHTPQGTITAEEMLPACAASLTACWHLLNGTEFALVEQAVQSYLPLLKQWASSPGPMQRQAAALAAEGSLLLCLTTLHRTAFQSCLRVSQESVTWARVADDPLLQTKALAELGSTYLYLGRDASLGQEAYQRAVSAFEEAVRVMKATPALVQSRVLFGLATAYAYAGQTQQAFTALRQAQQQWSAAMAWSPAREPLPAYWGADEGEHRTILWEASVYLGLAEQEPAYSSEGARVLAQAETRQSQGIPKRLQIALLVDQARAAVTQGELECYVLSTQRGIQEMRDAQLPSQKRKQELVSVFKQALRRWPQERQVLDLADMLV